MATWDRLALFGLHFVPAGMLVWAAWPHAYSYFGLLRVVVTIFAVIFAGCWHERSGPLFWTLAAMAMLFNPFVPIHLSRGTWVPIDLAAAGVFLWSMVAFLRFEAQRTERESAPPVPMIGKRRGSVRGRHTPAL